MHGASSFGYLAQRYCIVLAHLHASAISFATVDAFPRRGFAMMMADELLPRYTARTSSQLSQSGHIALTCCVGGVECELVLTHILHSRRELVNLHHICQQREARQTPWEMRGKLWEAAARWRAHKTRS